MSERSHGPTAAALGRRETEAGVKRILLVEDDGDREAALRSWVPADVRVVVARSAGLAIGVLKRDQGDVYAGIILDFNLDGRRITESDGRLTGNDLVGVISECCSRSTQILVHSNSQVYSPRLVRALEIAGFDVTRIPMSQLTAEDVRAWVTSIVDDP